MKGPRMTAKQEAPKKRTTADVQRESQHLQLRAGGIEYTIVQGKKDLALIYDRMRDLVTEYHLLKEQEDSEAALRKEIEEQVKKQAEPKVEPPKAPVPVEPPKPVVEQLKPAPEAYKPAAEQLKPAGAQNPTNVEQQVTTQADSGAAQTQPQVDSDGQDQKKE